MSKNCWKCGTAFDGIYTGQVHCPSCRIIMSLEEQEQRREQHNHYPNTNTDSYDLGEPRYVEPHTLLDYVCETIALMLVMAPLVYIMWPILKIFYNFFQ